MKKSQQLYELIHSMSKSEKRYFKLNRAKEASVYVRLFDLILAQNVYNRAPLVYWLLDEGVKSSLSKVQYHLYALILKSLGDFQSNKHPRYEVLNAIQQYMLLRDRGLHDQGRQLLRGALKTALNYNYYGLTLEIYDLMEDWVTEEANYSKALKQKAFLEIAIRSHQNYINDIAVLKIQIYELRLFFLKQKFVRTKEQKTFLLQFLDNNEAALKIEKNNLKRRLLMTILIYVYYGLQDYKALLSVEKKRLELLEVSFKAHVSPFLAYAYHRNLLWISLQNKDYTAHQVLVEQMNEPNYLKRVVRSNFYIVKLNIAKKATALYACVEQGHYRPAYHQIKALWELHQRTSTYWDSNLLVNTLILFMNTTFCLGKYEETIDWLQLLELDIPAADLLPYRNMGKIAHLLIHDGLGDYQYIQNVLESTRIRLYRKHEFFEVANVFLQFFRKKIGSKNVDREELLRTYKAKMEVVAAQEGQKGFFILFNFVDWFDSKLQNCSIADLNRKF